MKQPSSSIKQYHYTVKPEDVAAFHGETVHPVCSTYVLAREIEWSTRLFVLEMKDEDEEGIGTHLSIDHKSPAFIGEEIIFTARISQLNGHELICTCEATAGDRLIATGSTGQKILKKEKLERILTRSV
ncbi:MAG TPA: hotdog domain-containing protein [Ohtaekwangia sp.]|uniref:thioesterase family protein n=1 Tax=Ohtaekwangia sp. TaxID=2066019 RepID=UPI002F91C7C3